MSLRIHRDSPETDCCHSQGMVIAPGASALLGTLLAQHSLRNGEVIYLALKPSLWFIPLSSLRFIAAVLIVAIAAAVIDSPIDSRVISYFGAAAFIISGRLTWATLQWMGRLYVLTDQRIMRLQGVFQIDVFDCMLRQVARVDIVRSTRERIFRLGTMHITPADQNQPLAQWQMVARPDDVHAQIVDAIERSRRCGGMIKAA